MKLYFVCNHSPLQFKQWLGNEVADIKAKATKRCSGILLYTNYSQNKSTIESLVDNNVKIVVFDGPITALSLDANLLDIKRTETPPYYGIEFIKFNRNVWRNGLDTDLVFKKYDHQIEIIKAIESKSLLNSLMTAIYVLPSSSQKQVKIGLINWLFFDGHRSNLGPLLTALSERTRITKNSIDQLVEIMNSELAATYAKALKQKGEASDVAKAFNISDYDIRYMQKIKGSKSDYLHMLRG